MAYRKCVGKTRKATLSRFGAKETVYNGHNKGALPRDVLKVPALAGGKGFKERTSLKHPTQKPLALTEKLLKSKINGQRGKVLIPFAGSGSECVMAKRLKIDFYRNRDQSRLCKSRKNMAHSYRLTPRMVQNLENLLRKYHELFSGGRCTSWRFEGVDFWKSFMLW